MDGSADAVDGGSRSAPSEAGTSGSARSTPSHSSPCPSSGPASRQETPGPLPKYRYSRDELMKFRESPHSHKYPDSLVVEPSIVLTPADKKKAELAQSEKEPVKRKPSADPKVRLKEEEEEGLGIVLSPQRRSFGTGCHVTSTSLSKESASRRSGSPNDIDVRDRRGERRIGSGRIMIDRDHERGVREPRGRFDRDIRDRDSRDIRDIRDREPRDLRDFRDRDRDRDHRDRDFRDHDDQRGFNRVADRFGRNDRDRDRDRRDFGDRRMDNRRGYRRPEPHEEEPEWFTGGPSSQNEFIELHGFDGPKRGEKKEKKDTPRKDQPKLKSANEDEEKPVTAPKKPSAKKEAAKPEPSKEPSAPSSSEAAEEQPQNSTSETPAFDFSEFLKSDNIPGLAPENLSAQEQTSASSSRFSQWFQGRKRDASINEEFSYLDDLVSGSKSPAVPSPPPDSKGFPQLFSPITAGCRLEAHSKDQESHLQHLLQSVSQNQPNPSSAHNTSAMEANLRAMLINKPNETSMHSAQQPPAIPFGGKVLTAAELEGSEEPRSTPPSIQPSDLFTRAAFEQQRPLGVPPRHPLTNAFSSPAAPGPPAPPKGTMMKVWELEAGMKETKEERTPEQVKIAQQLHQQQQQQQQQHLQQQQMKTPEAGQMAAFNKLKGMMEASGSLQQTPRMPQKADGRPLSPLSVMPPKVDQNMHQQNLIQNYLMQQQKKLQLQKQEQMLQEQYLKAMKQQQILQPPASPLAPGISLATSPHCPSPAMPQAALLQQPPASPRAASPIMFGSQPPMHLTAPSPVHASPLSPTSQTLSPNSALQHPGIPQRVPSPKELAVHNQVILQNALIKRQLEEQKERFRKKQESIITTSQPKTPSVNNSTPAAGTGKLTPAFMPTSVIRKLASEKADEAKKSSSPVIDGNLQKQAPPILKIVKSDSMEENFDRSEEHSDSGFQDTPVAEPSILVSPPGNEQNFEHEPSFDLQLRLQEMNRRAAGSQPPSTCALPQGRPIVKNSMQAPMMSPTQERPITGVKAPSFLYRNPAPTPQMVQGAGMPPNMQANALLLQRMRGSFPPMNATALNQLALQGQQPPSLTPAQAAAVASMANSRGSASALASYTMPHNQQQPYNRSPAVRQDMLNGPCSPVIPNASISTLMGQQSSHDTNLTKWFGSDVLKQQLPDMPPLPTQGQRALTVDEIERR